MLIELKDVNKYYKGKRITFHALKDINLCINQGEMIAIKGKSGAGKSTLLHVIGCLDNFDGTYMLDQEEINFKNDGKTSKLRNKKFGFVMQDFALISNLSVYNNISIPLLISDERKIDINEIVEKVARQVGIYNQLNKNVNELSGGQKQRVAIARAMVNSPGVILADEPTGALDTATSNEIMDLLKELNNQGLTIIIVTHDPIVSEYCTRKIYIEDGRITQD